MAIVKSRSWMTGRTPAGNLTAEMWIEFADILAGEIDGDEFRDRVGRAVQLDFVTHDVQHAAALDTGRLLFIDEVDRNIDVHFRVLADAQEIDMHREVPDGI